MYSSYERSWRQAGLESGHRFEGQYRAVLQSPKCDLFRLCDYITALIFRRQPDMQALLAATA